LTPGREYQIQLFASDARGCCSTRTQFFTDGAGNNSPTFTQGTFTSIVGTFTADASFQNIGISASSNAPILDAFVVRDVTAASGGAPVTFTAKPDSVNRIIGGASAAIHFEDFFSTHGNSIQHSLVQMTGGSLQSVLESALGPLGPLDFYQINSAVLTIGSASDDYAATAGAHEVLVVYDPLTVTFNSFNNGGMAGVDYEASPETVGVVNGSVTDFDLTAFVQAAADAGTDLSLFFPTTGLQDNANFTAAGNLMFTINAEIGQVPEPASIALWLIMAAGALGCAWRWRRQRASC
jgi:hypothetical protein